VQALHLRHSQAIHIWHSA